MSLTREVFETEKSTLPKRNFDWFIIDEFYGNNGVFSYVLAHVVYDMARLFNQEFVAKSVTYYLARGLAPNVYIAYERLSYNDTKDMRELGCPIGEEGTVYVSAKAV